MADDADRADAALEVLLAAQLARRMPPAPAAIGECLNCGEPLAPPLRWCDAACRDDWQRINRAPAR